MQNMIKFFQIVLFLLVVFDGAAQKKNRVLVKIGDFPVTTDEFIANYRKNNTNILDEKDKKTPSEYLDLYINFKLKVLEAQRLGYDTVRSFVDELNGYRQELAKPYLTDVSFDEKMVQTAYYRTKYERKASHLLIRVNPDASPADTLAAWNKIESIRQQIVAGADFNEMAVKYSEDPSVIQNKGLLGYFSAFQMVYPFENSTYHTPVGQVSEIVRTRFGYHLIKVHDERQTLGEIKVAHIMKMFPQQATDETIANLKQQADSIWQKAAGGADFAELAKKYSDDKQSAVGGGVMNWFSPTNMVPSFAEAAFALKNDGDISPVIRTPYGWHIIKRLELRTTPSFDKLKPELENKIRQNPSISKYSDEAFDRKLRAEYHLTTDESVFRKLNASVADSVQRKDWPASVGAMKSNALIRFANQSLTVGDFTDFLQKQNFLPQSATPEGLKLLLDKFIQSKLLEYEDRQLERKYPEFARTFREYHDGILLFNISKDKIWDAASNDTTRLQDYFNRTTKKYFWTDRFKGWIIRAKSADVGARVEALFDQKEVGRQELTDIFNINSENNIQITDVAVTKGENPVVDYYIWSGPKPSGFDETTTFVHGKIVQNELKTLSDAWGLYSSDFQEVIEKEWIDSLRGKYSVVINKKELKKIQEIE